MKNEMVKHLKDNIDDVTIDDIKDMLDIVDAIHSRCDT